MVKYLSFLLFFLLGNFLFAQTVSTFFSDPNIAVDDGLIFDTNGNLYGSNYNGTTVYKITPTGAVSVFASGLNTPNGLAFDSNENLFVVNSAPAGEIKKFDINGNLLEIFMVGSSPSGIIKDRNSDDMIFTRGLNNSLHRLSPDGTVTDIFQGAPLNFPIGLAYDDSGNLYVGNFAGREIYKVVSSTLEFVATVPDGGSSSDPFLGYITFANGSLWGTVYLSHKIYKINPNAIDDTTLFAGSFSGNTDGSIDIATFRNPNGIVFNASENALYISEFNATGNIRKISDAPLSVDDVNNSSIDLNISPNPSNSIIKISSTSKLLASSNQFDVFIFDITGKIIYSNIVQDSTINNFTIDISNYDSGVYFLKIITDNGFRVSKSILKY